MKMKLKCLATMTLILIAAQQARAGSLDSLEDHFLVSGYGTLGLVHSTERQADFTSSSIAPSGAGYSDAWSAAVDSLLGLQLKARINSHVSAVFQAVAEQNYNDTYTPRVEWANIKYEFSPDTSIRVGRIVLPVFLLSDSRKVGFANTWVRPPLEIYSLEPLTNSDGIDVSYRFQWAGNVARTSVSYGKTALGVPGGGRAEARNLVAVAETIERGALTLHASFVHAIYNYTTFDPLFDAFRQYGPQGARLAEHYAATDKVPQFFAVAASYDPGTWFAISEWGRRRLNSALGASTAWYVSGGYRLEQFTPYATYAEVTADSPRHDPGLDLSSLPPGSVAAAAVLNTQLNTILGAIAVQRTVSLGIRWDMFNQLDLKFQYDYSRLGSGSPGTLSNLQPTFKPGGSASLVSISLDFVW